MFRYDFKKRPLIESAIAINVGNFVRRYQPIVKNIYRDVLKKEFDITSEYDCKVLIEAMKLEGVKVQQIQGDKEELGPANYLQLTYSKSNLGRGFIFWFVCNNCQNKARFLYAPTFSANFYCRACHKLVYKKQNLTRDRELALLIRNPSLILSYSVSNNFKKQLALYKVLILKEDAQKQAKEEVELLRRESL